MLRVSSRVISRTFTNKAAPASKRAVDVTGPSATKPPPKASSSGSSPLPLLVLVAGAGGFGYMLNSNKEFRNQVTAAVPALKGPVDSVFEQPVAAAQVVNADTKKEAAKPAAAPAPAVKKEEVKRAPTAVVKKEAAKPAPTPAPVVKIEVKKPPPANVATDAPSTVPDISATHAGITQQAQAIRLSSISDSVAELNVVSSAMKKELDETILKDINSLDASELRYRIIQLAAEMKERTKWEALRLREFLGQAEKNAADKYQGVLQEQRLKFEELLARQLREQEDALERRANEKMKKREGDLSSMMEQKWQAQVEQWNTEASMIIEREVGNATTEIKKAHAKLLEERVTEVSNLTAKLSELEHKITKGGLYEERSGKVHRIVGGIMGLVGSIETGDCKDLKTDIATLRKICSDDEVLSAALKTVSKNVIGNRTMTMSELQARFKDVKKIGRKMVLVGEGPGSDGLSGLFAGEIYSRVLVPVDERTSVNIPEKEVGDEERIARAGFYVRTGKLEKAIEALEKIEAKKAKKVMGDWMKAAKAKTTVDGCVSILKLRCSALNEGMK